MPVLGRVLAGVLIASASSIIHAQEAAVPQKLTLGYEHEGKIDASHQACVALVKEITEWDAAQTEKGARQVCAARKRHVDAYNQLQTTYRNFVKAYSVDRRLNLPGSVDGLKALFKGCVDHKQGLTTGGHNINIDIIENEITASCLTLSHNLLKEETAKYTVPR